MLKATAVAIITGTLTLGAATQANEVLEFLAPQAARVVSDTNLRTVYTAAVWQANMENRSIAEVLPDIARDLGTAGIRYTVSEDGMSIRAETDWSCRTAVVEDVWVRLADC